MNDEFSVDHLNHAQIVEWLAAALKGDKPLPRAMYDEPHNLAILRLEFAQEPQTRRSISVACTTLLREFCQHAQGEAAYVKQLLALTARLKIPESISMLVRLTERFKDLPDLGFDIRNAVLGVLTMGSPPQSFEFWQQILQQDKQRYAARAIAGALSWDKMQAVQMLPDMPDTEPAGTAVMLNFDLAWDDLPSARREWFVDAVQDVLPRCGAVFAAPIAAWVREKTLVRQFINNVVSPNIAASIRTRFHADLGDADLPRRNEIFMHSKCQPSYAHA